MDTQLNHSRKERIQGGTLVLLISISAAIGLWMTRTLSPKVDESFHYKQIRMFISGEWEMLQFPPNPYPFFAMIPGYHAVAALLFRAGDVTHPMWYRGLSTLSGAGVFVASWLIGRRLDPPSSVLRAAQVFFIPLSFPFFFLVYSDTFSLLVWVAALAATLAGGYTVGGGFGLASLLVRQNSIPIVGCVGLAGMLKPEGTIFDRSTWQFSPRRWAPFVPAIVFFIGFVAWNGRIPLCHPKMQQSTISWGNLLFALSMTSLWVLPIQIRLLPDILAFIRRAPWASIAVTVVLAVGVGGYTVTDERNLDCPELLRNYVLLFLVSGFWPRVILWVLASWAGLSLLATRWTHPAGQLTIPLWVACLVPVGLVEPRYYIPLVAWQLLFRQHFEHRWEWAQLGVFVLLSAIVHWVHTNTYFLL